MSEKKSVDALVQIRNKIQSIAEIQVSLEQVRAENRKIVFTNGCFDLLHFGHLYYLCEARDLGDFLVVGLNSTKSVRRLKGEHRPINDEQTRQHLLAALECVDAVVEFEEDTPARLIQAVQPDILVKGGDYLIEEIVGADFVLKNGGEVKTLAFVSGYSTSNIEQKIRLHKD